MVIVLFLGLQTRCDAYIDPNAGGFLLQILAPLGALATSFFIYFRKQVFGLLKRNDQPAATPGPTVSDSKL
jgi:hypothetical protein